MSGFLKGILVAVVAGVVVYFGILFYFMTV